MKILPTERLANVCRAYHARRARDRPFLRWKPRSRVPGDARRYVQYDVYRKGGLMAAVLKIGSNGPEVTQLQHLLIEKTIPRPNIQGLGVFGPTTDVAVRTFQRQKGLVDDGIVGPRTWAALGVVSGKQLIVNVQDRHNRLVNGFFTLLGNDKVHDVTSVNDMIETVLRAAKQSQGKSTDMRVIYQLHIYGHGNSGLQQVGGGQQLNVHNLSKYSSMLMKLTPYFRQDAIAFFRGCKVGEGPMGTQFLQKMSQIWGVPVQGGTIYQKPQIPGAEGVSKRCDTKHCTSFQATWWDQPDHMSDVLHP